jgi:hypothetical protein
MNTDILDKQVYPSKVDLVRALEAYRDMGIDLQEQKDKLEKAEHDLERALYSNDDIESERLQITTIVARKRIDNRESQLKQCFGQLEQAIIAAIREVNDIVMSKWSIQKDELLDAVLNVLSPSNAFDRVKLEEVLEGDTRIEAVRALSVMNYERRMIERFTQNPISKITTEDGIQEIMDDRHIVFNHSVDIEFVIGCAESILKKFDQLENI